MSEALQQTIQFALIALIGVSVPALVVAAIVFVRTKGKELASQIGLEQLAIIKSVIAIVVKAAEQAHLKEELFETGEQMLEWAVEQAQIILARYGITNISVEEIVQSIRAALRDGVHKAEVAAVEVTPTVVEVRQID